MIRCLTLTLGLIGATATACAQPGGDVNDATEKAMQDAIAKVAPSVVRLEPIGGNDVVVWVDPATRQAIRKVVGPTTGVIVSADGYIVSSAYNFTNKPKDIFVQIPGKGKRSAKIVATDQTRSIILLKAEEVVDLPVPSAVPRAELAVGQWSMALGRALNNNVEELPSVSTGILSALNRIWGKAIQTDARISPVNYGGPLIGLDGRVQGILIPASPQGQDETAGVEWYDSGIGFAIPFEDIMRVVPKLKEGKDLLPGMLGIVPQGTDLYGTEPVIGAIAPDSTAAKADLRVGDKIVSIDGKPTANQAQVLHILKPKYEGEVVSIVINRDGRELRKENLRLQGQVTSFVPSSLGILPLRDDTGPGVEIRYVFPNGPAAKAGLKAGDRILSMGPPTAMNLTNIPDRPQLQQMLSTLRAGQQVKVGVKRAGSDKTEQVSLTLAALGDDLPTEPIPPGTRAVAKPPAKDPKEKERTPPETGLIKKRNEALKRSFWVFVPETYIPERAHGIVIWLHPAGRGGRDDQDMVDLWEEYCERYQLILVGPIARANEGWSPSETSDILADVKLVLDEYTIDRNRIIVHGSGIGGQMAFYMGFSARDLVRGVASVGAVLASTVKDTVPNQRLSFFVVGGTKDPLFKDILESVPKLTEKKHPVLFREMPEVGKEYLNRAPAVFADLLKWIDSLDRL